MAKLTCQQAEQLFDAYLDGELSASLETELDAHRLACAACRQALALMEVTGHMISADRHAPVLGEDFTQRLLACIETPRPIPIWRRRRTIWVAGSGLAAAAAIAIAFTFPAAPPKKVAGWQERAPSVSTSALPPGALKEHFDGQISQVRESTEWLANFGKMTVMQILDRLGLEQPNAGEKFGAPDSKRPGSRKSASDDDKRDIEDL
ncbi:MAG TPA: zf-HC2 domain-containing protein [Phycisphaerae bacterium]|jgi:hypothetical protein